MLAKIIVIGQLPNKNILLIYSVLKIVVIFQNMN